VADQAVYPGLWECGDCGDITNTAHYVMDRMTGRMVHQADANLRRWLGHRCGWSSTYGGYHDPPMRCALPHGHGGHHDPQVHGFGKFTEDRALPPYDPASANLEPPRSGRKGGQ
jgi:hypothetical protein